MDSAGFRIHTLSLAFADGHHEDIGDFSFEDGESPQQVHERICRLRGASHVEYRATGFAPVLVDRPLRAD